MAHLGDIQRIHRALAALGGNETEVDEALDMAGKTTTCRPWSRQDFVERLQSYSSGTWFAKPEIISPMVCARHGWLNVSMDTLRCVSCAQKVSHLHDCTISSSSLKVSCLSFLVQPIALVSIVNKTGNYSVFFLTLMPQQLQFGFGGLGFDDTEEAAVNFARHLSVSN